MRERVGVMDFSSFAKYDVTGEGAEAYLNRITANRMPRRIGGIVLAHYLSAEGRILGESTITKLAPDRFYVLSGAGAEDRDMDSLVQGPRDGLDVTVTNVTDDWGVLVLAGPRSREVLAKLTDAELGNGHFRWLTGREIEAAGIPIRALRVNYVGELGWELHCPMGRLAELYDAVWSAGEEFGIADFGVYAVDSLAHGEGVPGLGGGAHQRDHPGRGGHGALRRLRQGRLRGQDRDAARQAGGHRDPARLRGGGARGLRRARRGAGDRRRQGGRGHDLGRLRPLHGEGASASPTWSRTWRRPARRSPSTSSASRARRRCSPSPPGIRGNERLRA